MRALDVSTLTLNLLTSVDDSPQTNSDDFVRTVSSVTNVPIAGALTPEVAWAVSRDAEAKLAAFAGMKPGELECQGFLIGRVTGGDGQGVPDVRVVRAGSGSPIDQVIYPSPDLSRSRAATTLGVFVVPSAKFESYVMFDVEGEQVSKVHRGASTPGTAAALHFEYIDK